jgi:hypothetical protein
VRALAAVTGQDLDGLCAAIRNTGHKVFAIPS